MLIIEKYGSQGLSLRGGFERPNGGCGGCASRQSFHPLGQFVTAGEQ